MDKLDFGKLMARFGSEYTSFKLDDEKLGDYFRYFKHLTAEQGIKVFDLYTEENDIYPNKNRLLKVINRVKPYRNFHNNQAEQQSQTEAHFVAIDREAAGEVQIYRDGKFFQWGKKADCFEYRGRWLTKIDYCMEVMGVHSVCRILKEELGINMVRPVRSSARGLVQAGQLMPGNFASRYKAILEEMIILAQSSLAQTTQLRFEPD